MKDDVGIELPKRKRNPDDGEMDVTPMIDVTFLLLAFFVVVSRMDPQAAVDLPIASFGISVPDKNCVTLVVTPTEDGTGHVIYKGRSMSDDSRVIAVDEEDQETEIAEFVENELTAHPTKTAVLIKAEGDVKTGAVELTKRGVAGSELALSRLVYVGVEEEQ